MFCINREKYLCMYLCNSFAIWKTAGYVEFELPYIHVCVCVRLFGLSPKTICANCIAGHRLIRANSNRGTISSRRLATNKRDYARQSIRNHGHPEAANWWQTIPHSWAKWMPLLTCSCLLPWGRVCANRGNGQFCWSPYSSSRSRVNREQYHYAIKSLMNLKTEHKFSP